MNTPTYRKRSFFTGERAIVMLVLLLIVLVPSQTLAATMGWIRCNLSSRDICYTEGNVGIGLTNPEAALDVVGSGKFSDALYLGGNSGDLIVSDNSIYDFKRILLTNDDIINANNITIHDPGPNEGIVWNQAGAKIYVAPLDNSNTDGYLRLINDGGIAFEPSGVNSQALTINADSNVGIGTTTPATRLHIVGADNDGTVAGLTIESPEFGPQMMLLDGNEIDGKPTLSLNFNSDAPVYIAEGGGGIIMAPNNGNVGVGTSSANSKLEVDNGYIELDTHNGTPPDADCDAQDEVGRMKVDSRRPYLYICTANGWVRK